MVLSSKDGSCARATDVKEAVETTVDLFVNSEINNAPNHDKTYYSYYLPQGVTNLESGDTYNILEIGGYKVLINIDIDQIISDEYYTDAKKSDVYSLFEPVYSFEGRLYEDMTFDLRVYAIDDKHLLYLIIDDVAIASLINLDAIDQILYDMLVVGTSIRTRDDLIINDFSSRDVIDYHQETIDLFEIIVPQDGRLEELLKPN